MAVFGPDVDRPLYGRGPSAGLRFTVYAILSIALMYYDQHGHWVQRLHFALDAAAYPVQVAVSSPRTGLELAHAGLADARCSARRKRAAARSGAAHLR